MGAVKQLQIEEMEKAMEEEQKKEDEMWEESAREEAEAEEKAIREAEDGDPEAEWEAQEEERQIQAYEDQLEQQAIDEEIERMVFPAEIVYGSEFFWCDEFMEVGETGESCGKECKKYSPRNGKNGRCRHHKNCYTHADKPITIKINQ